MSSQLTRLQAKRKSPILQMIQECFYGKTTIGFFGNYQAFTNKFNNIVDTYSKCSIHLFGTYGFFDLRICLLSLAIYATIILVSLIQINFVGASAFIAISISYSVNLSDNVSSFFDSFGNVELGLVPLERCMAYTKIKTEKANSELKIVSKNISIKGPIQFSNYSTVYRPEWPVVLKDFTLKIDEGEKIGIIGRTGSGKSTIFLSLLGILEPTFGELKIGKNDIKTIDKRILRRGITIIAQDPSIFMGSLRENIDPLNEFDEEEVTEAIKITGLDKFLEGDLMGFQIEEQGKNLSIGLKQLICFERAILKRSKIILMDEATSSMDLETEASLKHIVESYFKNSTMITIAHRLNSIKDYDKIVVIDSGKVSKVTCYTSLLDNFKIMD